MNHYRRMYTVVFIVAGYAIFGAPRAATYYLSSVTGNDNRTAVEAQSPETPWKTPERLTSVSLAPGDRVLFAHGPTDRESTLVATTCRLSIRECMAQMSAGSVCGERVA